MRLKFFTRSLFPSASCVFPAVYHHSVRPATRQHQQLCSPHLLLVLELSEFNHCHWIGAVRTRRVGLFPRSCFSGAPSVCPLYDRHSTGSQMEARKGECYPTCALQNDCSNGVVCLRSTYKLDTITGCLRDRAVTCLCCRFWPLLFCRAFPPFSNAGLDSDVENCCQQGWASPSRFHWLPKYIPQTLRDLHFQAREH